MFHVEHGMRLTRVDIRGLRRLDTVSFAPGPGLNVFVGPNGAGKTSVLEAVHLMAYGRSFRGRVRDGLVRSHREALEVFVEWTERTGGLDRTRRAGLRHAGASWTGRLDGETVSQLGDLCAALAAVTFEPGSHDLISGSAELRRRYLDWGLFHVEPAFLPVWRRYARALKQRNRLLKLRIRDGQLDAWEHELATVGEPVTAWRRAYADALQGELFAVAGEFLPSLGLPTLRFQPGWRQDELSLADALLVSRDRDLQSGFTSVGPHRADWRIAFAGLPNGESLSRGQAKLTALAAILTQGRHHAAARGHWPVILLDDLASELDRAHQARVIGFLAATGAQVLLTGTHAPEIAGWTRDVVMFHVEPDEQAAGPSRVSTGSRGAEAPELL